MKKGINLFLIACTFLSLASCKNDAVPADYIKAMQQEEAINKKVKAGAILYTFHVSTPEAMALQDSYDADKKTVNKEHYHERLQELKGFIYLRIDQKVADRNISVLKYKAVSNGEYEQRVMYYQFYAGNDVRMLCNGKEYPPSSYQYENQQDISPVNSLLMAFPLCNEKDEFQVVLNDRAMNNLLIKTTFNKKDIERLPRLSIN